MADQQAVETFLDNNPQVAKAYFEKQLKAEVIGAAFTEKLNVKDTASFKDATQVVEAAFLFEMVKDMQGTGPMEKSLHKVLQRMALLLKADKCSYFTTRSRNGTPELSTLLFDVTPTSVYEKNLVNPDGEIVFPLDMGIVGKTASSKKFFNIPDVKQVSLKIKPFNYWCIVYIN